MNITRLKELRIKNRYNQSDLANLLGMKQQQYSEYEIGKRLISIETLSKLADIYNTSVDYLIGRTNEKKPYNKIK